MSKNVVLKKDKKFEFLYLKNVPVFFASVLEPKKKYSEPDPADKNQSKREYALTAFVDDDAREYLEDEVLINKQLFKVGKDKNKKRKVKFPLEKQLKDGDGFSYDAVDGLNGIQLTLNEFTNSGKPARMVVVGTDGKPFKELVGNGSVCNIKCFGYRNQDDQLVVSLNIVQVVEHVPYEGGDSNKIVDDELGIDVEFDDSEKTVNDEFDSGSEDAPFDPDEDDADY